MLWRQVAAKIAQHSAPVVAKAKECVLVAQASPGRALGLGRARFGAGNGSVPVMPKQPPRASPASPRLASPSALRAPPGRPQEQALGEGLRFEKREFWCGAC